MKANDMASVLPDTETPASEVHTRIGGGSGFSSGSAKLTGAERNPDSHGIVDVLVKNVQRSVVGRH